MLNIPVKIKCHHLYPKAQSSKNWEAKHKVVTTACNARGIKIKIRAFLWIAEDTVINYSKFPTLKSCDVTNNHVLQLKVQCLDALSPLPSNSCLVAFFHFFGATCWCPVLTDL